jgi:hypothetical protein
MAVNADLVRDAIRRAKENGYDLDAWSEWEVAEDLCEYDSDFEGVPVEDIYEAVCLIRNGDSNG